MRHFVNFGISWDDYLENLTGKSVDEYPNLKDHAENSLRGLVSKYPNSEVGYTSANYINTLGNRTFKDAINLPSKEAISTSIPLDRIVPWVKGYPNNLGGLENLQMAHTHPTILSAKAAGVSGKDVDVSNIPRYPSFQDLISDKSIRQNYESLSKKGVVNPSLVITREYDEPVTYKYKFGLPQKNFYSTLNAAMDGGRLAALDSELYKVEPEGKYKFVDDLSKPFLRRAALEEQMGRDDGFFHGRSLEIERQAAHPIPSALPNVGKSRLGETVATANAVGLAHGGYRLKKAYDERRRQKQADDVQLTNKYQ